MRYDTTTDNSTVLLVTQQQQYNNNTTTTTTTVLAYCTSTIVPLGYFGTSLLGGTDE